MQKESISCPDLWALLCSLVSGSFPTLRAQAWKMHASELTVRSLDAVDVEHLFDVHCLSSWSFKSLRKALAPLLWHLLGWEAFARHRGCGKQFGMSKGLDLEATSVPKMAVVLQVYGRLEPWLCLRYSGYIWLHWQVPKADPRTVTSEGWQDCSWRRGFFWRTPEALSCVPSSHSRPASPGKCASLTTK